MAKKAARKMSSLSQREKTVPGVYLIGELYSV